MADFVAVIRRTVDGLSDNVPEMRAKVYEKARGAVRRQLENMKPRPSDDMIDRQMVKLEAAIAEVEGENAEALPALEETLEAQPPEVDAVDNTYEHAPEPEPEAPTHEEVAEEAPAAEEPSYPAETQDVETHAEPEAPVEPVYEEPIEPPYEEEPAAPSYAAEEPVEHVREDVPEVVAEEHQPYDTDPAHWNEPVEHSAEVAEQPAPVHDEPEYHAEPEHYDEPARYDEPAPVAAETVEQYPDDPEEHAHELEREPAEQAPIPASVEQPLPGTPGLLKSSEWELPEWNDKPPVPVTAHNEPVWTEAADEVVVADEVPDLTHYEPVETVTPLHDDVEAGEKPAGEASHSWSWDDSDPFAQGAPPEQPASTEPAISDWSWPVEKPVAATEPETQKSDGDGWNDVDELLQHGTVPVGVAAASAASAQRGRPAPLPDAIDEMEVPARPVSYRVEPKKSSFNLKSIGLVVVLLLLLGGGGYGYWQNQTAVNTWVSGMVASVTAQIPGQAPTDTPAVPAEEGARDVPAQDGAAQTPATTHGQAETDVAALDTGASTKFTQRLQQDGTEIDQGPAAGPAGEASAEEGKSVAAQTEAGQPQDSAAQATPVTPGAQTNTQTQPAQSVPDQQPAANPATQQIPAGAQKMFLYEERLGQSAPTAIEGNVVWSMKEESPGGDAKPEPVIQAQINVPERGLTALMTIKRNVDSSLPASHVIEFVFSLPENFEGGSIDSVQRVAMKRNEQDRGDALIAVPAKITEDFHMIALNDFPEAVATNTDLLRSRSWIDIPLTYRNGRRALLTLEKGVAGTDAFTKAMQAWSVAARPNPAGQ